MDEKTALQVFFDLHSDLPREGPGNNECTARALSFLTELPDCPQILDLGCGPGMQTLHLAQLTQGQITAVDIHPPYLEQLHRQAQAAGLSDRITLRQADMGNLSLPPESFDVVWAEGSAYILEFGNALRQWRSLLKPRGYLAATEVSWLRPDPPAEVVEFWQTEYPGLQSIEANLALIKAAGYFPLAHFVLPAGAWWQFYYTPLEQRLQTLQTYYTDNADAQAVLTLHQQEIDLFRRYADYYGYVFYILQKDA